MKTEVCFIGDLSKCRDITRQPHLAVDKSQHSDFHTHTLPSHLEINFFLFLLFVRSNQQLFESGNLPCTHALLRRPCFESTSRAQLEK